MAKEDVPALPDRVPTKRRHIESILPVHLAMWLDEGSGIPPLARKKLTEEKERRKTLRPDVRVGVIVGGEGVTPQQFKKFQEVLPTMGATEFIFPRLPGKIYFFVKNLGVPTTLDTQQPVLVAAHDIVKNSTSVVAMPKDVSGHGGVWELVKYAKHRSTPVRVILPSGEEQR